MAIAIDIPHTPIVSVQKSYNRSMTTENNKNSRFANETHLRATFQNRPSRPSPKGHDFVAMGIIESARRRRSGHP